MACNMFNQVEAQIYTSSLTIQIPLADNRRLLAKVLPKVQVIIFIGRLERKQNLSNLLFSIK